MRERGYAQRMPIIPLRIKIAMWIAFFAIMGVWSWIVSKAVYVWLPEWITIPVGLGFLALSVGYYGREAWLAIDRRIVRKHHVDAGRSRRLPGRPE